MKSKFYIVYTPSVDNNFLFLTSADGMFNGVIELISTHCFRSFSLAHRTVY